MEPRYFTKLQEKASWEDGTIKDMRYPQQNSATVCYQQHFHYYQITSIKVLTHVTYVEKLKPESICSDVITPPIEHG